MLGETALRLPGFREGTRIRMSDGQDWSFPNPPEPGLDREFDGLIRAHLEAEDWDEALRIELAISVLLLSRNYALTPADYARIFDFGNDRGTLEEAQSALSRLIASHCERALAYTPIATADRGNEPGWIGKLTALLAAWVVRVKALLWS